MLYCSWKDPLTAETDRAGSGGTGENLSEIFAQRLKEEREARGWTQQYLAESLGLTNGTISGYERNYREPDFLTLSRIARLLEVPTAYLLGETDRKPKAAIAEELASYDAGPHPLPNAPETAEAIALIERAWSGLTPAERRKRLDFLKNYTKLLDDPEA